ncbi:MAG: hypothetical protein RLZZ490_1517 [Cyanobacteriota bacterium]
MKVNAIIPSGVLGNRLEAKKQRVRRKVKTLLNSLLLFIVNKECLITQ